MSVDPNTDNEPGDVVSDAPLFDSVQYRTRPELERKPKPAPPERFTVENDGSWFVLARLKKRPHPDAHQLVGRVGGGVDQTRCGISGRTIAIDIGMTVHPCPKCLELEPL